MERKEYILIGSQDKTMVRFIQELLGKKIGEVRAAFIARFKSGNPFLEKKPGMQVQGITYYTDEGGFLWREGHDHYLERSMRQRDPALMVIFDQKDRVDRK